MILLGIFIHYFIAFCFLCTRFFFYLYRKNRIFGLNKFVAALLYGIFIWAVMSLVVLPLSALPSRKITIGNALLDSLILAVMIGLPVSLECPRLLWGKRANSPLDVQRTEGKDRRIPRVEMSI